MTIGEKAIRDLMDSVLILRIGLEKIDPSKSIDENVELTGVEERFVKSYLLGMRAIGEA